MASSSSSSSKNKKSSTGSGSNTTLDFHKDKTGISLVIFLFYKIKNKIKQFSNNHENLLSSKGSESIFKAIQFQIQERTRSRSLWESHAGRI